METLPVPVGYGVEFATLTDTWQRHGLPAIAQVDLGRRGHRHQNVHDLGVMAAEILATAMRRLPGGATGPARCRRGAGPAAVRPATRAAGAAAPCRCAERPPAVANRRYRGRRDRCSSWPAAASPTSPADHGDRQPDPGLLLRPGRHLRLRQGAGPGGRGGGGRRRDRRHRRGEGGPGRRGGRRRGDPAHRRLRGRGARGVSRTWSSRSTPGGTRWAGRSARPAPTCSTTPGAATTRSWPRWPPSSTPALVCTHAGGVAPRTRPHRVDYDDVMADVLERDASGLAERAVALGRRPAADPDRPGPRLRQEHLAFAGGDPAAGRDGGHRLAGAGVAVEQGLRRRDAGPAAGASGCSAPWPPPRSAPGRAPRSSGRTTWPRPGRCSTWSPPSGAASRRGGPSGGWRDPHAGRIVAVPAARTRRCCCPA